MDIKLLSEKWIKTEEEWHPNFPGNTLRVRWYAYPIPTTPKYRVCIWGEDDFGMELDCDDIELARKAFLFVVDNITQKQLFEFGFVRA